MKAIESKRGLKLNKHDICNRLHISGWKRRVVLTKYPDNKIDNLKNWKENLKKDQII